MLTTANELIAYEAFGFKIHSNIVFSELKERTILINKEQPDVIIYKKEVVETSSNQNQNWEVQKNKVMFEVDNIAKFTIESGKKITITPLDDYNEQIAKIYILGSCFGALLYQRRIFPLHGSAIEIDGKAYLFIGEQGAGKSTIAATFLNEGYKLISDDVIPITIGKDNVPMVTPAYPQQKLWEDALNKIGRGHMNFRSIYGRERKYCVPVVDSYCTTPLPIGGIFELQKIRSNELEIQPIKGLHSLNVLTIHTYRNHILYGMELIEWHFNMISQLTNYVEILRIKRPEQKYTADLIKSKVLSKIYNDKEFFN